MSESIRRIERAPRPGRRLEAPPRRRFRAPALPTSSALRRLLLRRSSTLVVALLVAWLVASAVTQAERTTRGLAATEPVLVVSEAVAAGDRLDPSSLRTQLRPLDMVPAGALSTVDQLDPRTRVHAAMSAGEVVVAHRLSDDASSRIAATLPAGTSAVAVPLDPTATPVEGGDTVDVFTPVAAAAADATMVAAGAVVMSVDQERAVLAVRLPDVRRTAAAVLAAPVVLAVLGEDGAAASATGDRYVIDDE